MHSVALSQMEGLTVPPDILKAIDDSVAELLSLIEWRGNLGIVQRGDIVTDDERRWSYCIQEFTAGLPFSPIIYVPSQQKLLEGQESCEIYIADMIDGLKLSGIVYWLARIPQIIKKIIQQDLEKFSKRLPPSIPEHLKATGYTDL